jgi:hypoxanthine-DNA glycosylase
MESRGFSPIADANARVLVLGTLPGQVSLKLQQYYAQPRNVFWRIMGRLFGAHPELPYAERTRRLAEHGIALWDVCARAHRPGSLDSAIHSSSVTPNGFEAFLAEHPRIDLICFNGSKAADLYRRAVLPSLSSRSQGIRCEVLPSTSPAHAAMPFEEKLVRWSIISRERGL